MRTRLALLGVLVTVVVGVVGTGFAAADPGNGNGATVVRDPYGSPLYCNVYDATFTNIWIFQCTIQVVTNKNGVVEEWLKGTVDPAFSSPLPSQAVQVGSVWTGEECDPFSGAIYSTGTVTPSGNINLKCSSHPLAGS